MKNVFRKLWADQGGFVISVELILICTVLVIGLVSGMTLLRDAVNSEFADTAQAIGSINQSFAIAQTSSVSTGTDTNAISGGSIFGDDQELTDTLDGANGAQGTGLSVQVVTLGGSATDEAP